MPSSSQSADPIDSLSPDEAKAKLAALESTKLTRRQAFGKLGFTFAAAAVAVLSADDLLRAVGRQLERGAKDNRVAQQVAQEFKNAGVAFAVPSGGGGAPGPCTYVMGESCAQCCNSNCIQKALCAVQSASCKGVGTKDKPGCLGQFPLGNIDPRYQDCLNKCNIQEGRCDDVANSNLTICQRCNGFSGSTACSACTC